MRTAILLTIVGLTSVAWGFEVQDAQMTEVPAVEMAEDESKAEFLAPTQTDEDMKLIQRLERDQVRKSKKAASAARKAERAAQKAAQQKVEQWKAAQKKSKKSKKVVKSSTQKAKRAPASVESKNERPTKKKASPKKPKKR